ncbi:unnamed protein product [Diamesa serratosioi]
MKNAIKTLSLIVLFLMINLYTKVRADGVPNDGNESNIDKSFQSQDQIEQQSKRAWKQLQGSWGKRTVDGEENAEEQIRNIQRMLNYLQNEGYTITHRNPDYDVLSRNYIGQIDDNQPIEKRAWKSMNGGWGKRQNDWGKREQRNWNSLNGMWGKRSAPQSWNNLSSAWGKRK